MHHVIDVDEDYEIVGFYQLVSPKPPDRSHRTFLYLVWSSAAGTGSTRGFQKRKKEE